jgi:type III pantothenate kinase
MAIPIFTNYNTPETLGKDRLAGIVGANKEYPNKNILVIDAGSCITFDFFMDDTYCGGRISPGLQMRYDALYTFTNQLPQISISDTHFMIGKDTNSSIISGVQQGAIDEMDAVIDIFRKENKDSVVILCGGDYNFFDKHLKNSIFADPFIVLKGLNIILEFNAK